MTPLTLDWRLTSKVSSIKDQGDCGCCWVFSSVATAESYFLIKNNSAFDLAEEYVLDCTAGSNCTGGYIDTAMIQIKNQGIPLETADPY